LGAQESSSPRTMRMCSLGQTSPFAKLQVYAGSIN